MQLIIDLINITVMYFGNVAIMLCYVIVMLADNVCRKCMPVIFPLRPTVNFFPIHSHVIGLMNQHRRRQCCYYTSEIVFFGQRQTFKCA